MRMMVSESFDMIVIIAGLWIIANLVHAICNINKEGSGAGFFCLSDFIRKPKKQAGK